MKYQGNILIPGAPTHPCIPTDPGQSDRWVRERERERERESERERERDYFHGS